MRHNWKMTRRDLLGSSAAAFAFTVLPRRVLGDAPLSAPSNKLHVACIGAEGMGAAHVAQAAECENLVALCDVDENRLGRAARKHPQARTFTDYRRMFDQMAKDIDAVFVATPDHTHFPASWTAIHLGKHVYCQKPLTHSIWEARTLARAAREHKVATQMGNQGMASEGTRRLVEMIRAGTIGAVREVHIWTDRPLGWWAQGLDRPKDTPPVPRGLHWDLWLGVAPQRPYHPCYHPFAWRGWWDFGTGALGDIACHAMAGPFWALTLGFPTAVEAQHSGCNSETGPNWSIIMYEFPARGDLPSVKLVWYDGGKKPPRPDELDKDREMGKNGTIFVGDKGKILLMDGGPRLLPESRMKDFRAPEPTLPRVPSHHEDWFIACKGGRAASSNFDFSGPMTEAALVGNLAIRLGKRIEWDGANMKARNAPEADPLIHREYRKGWGL